MERFTEGRNVPKGEQHNGRHGSTGTLVHFWFSAFAGRRSVSGIRIL